jgi:hypothetical protein
MYICLHVFPLKNNFCVEMNDVQGGHAALLLQRAGRHQPRERVHRLLQLLGLRGDKD